LVLNSPTRVGSAVGIQTDILFQKVLTLQWPAVKAPSVLFFFILNTKLRDRESFKFTLESFITGKYIRDSDCFIKLESIFTQLQNVFVTVSVSTNELQPQLLLIMRALARAFCIPLSLLNLSRQQSRRYP
jgi:hypothetical protein